MSATAARTVLIPLPLYGFDPTETAIPWWAIREAGHSVTFSTPNGDAARADACMVSGERLPRLLKRMLMARKDDVAVYEEMASSTEFQQPVPYEDLEPERFDALLLPGGHDKGMRPYLEDPTLHCVVAAFFDRDKLVGAICHGTLLAARSASQDPSRQGKSVLWGRRTTGLTRNQELLAFWMTQYKLRDYYRTYPTPMMDDLVSHLRSPADYLRGPGWPVPLARDTGSNPRRGFTVRDGNYLSARWPGDAHAFARAFVAMLEGSASA